MFSFAKGCLIKQNRAFLIAIDKQIRLRLCVQFFKCYDNTARVKLSMKCRLNFFFAFGVLNKICYFSEDHDLDDTVADSVFLFLFRRQTDK